MMVTSVLSSTQATGQQREDEFSMGGPGAKHLHEQSVLTSLLALPNHTAQSYFNPRGRLFD